MNAFLRKVRHTVVEFVAPYGKLRLFGVFMRKESPNVWDVVLSAPFLDEMPRDILGPLFEALKTALTRSEFLAIARVAVLNATEAARFGEHLEHLPAGGLLELNNVSVDGLEIEKGYLFSTDQTAPPESASGGVAVHAS